MTITVHSQGKWVTLQSPGREPLRHEVPRRTKFLKEELRQFREEVTAWCCGEKCEEFILYKPPFMSFYRKHFYNAIFTASRTKQGVPLITTHVEKARVVR